jgi:hypothetical protein
LKGKLKGFEMAFTSVKKILGEGSFNMLSRLNPGSGTGEAPVGGNNTLPGFGIPRYAFDKD